MSNTAASLLVSLISLGRSLRCFRTRYLLDYSDLFVHPLVYRSTDVWLASTVEEVVLGSIGTSVVHPKLAFIVFSSRGFALRLSPPRIPIFRSRFISAFESERNQAIEVLY